MKNYTLHLKASLKSKKFHFLSNTLSDCKLPYMIPFHLTFTKIPGNTKIYKKIYNLNLSIIGSIFFRETNTLKLLDKNNIICQLLTFYNFSFWKSSHLI